MNPAATIDRAADVLDRARREPTATTLDALHRELLALAGLYEVTSPPDMPTVATWYALDAASAVWDAARRAEATTIGRRAPVRLTGHLLPLDVAGHAVLTARAALARGPA